MSRASNSDILLESGTNEIEIFEFMVDGRSYGINALKVREAVQFNPKDLNLLPMMPEGMMGSLLFRDSVTKIIDLRAALRVNATAKGARPIILFCDFNRQLLGFVVDEIKGIYRVSWENVQSPSPVLATTAITGVAVIGDREVSMLDLESLVAAIFGMDHDKEEKKPLPAETPFKILVADDSPLFRKKLKYLLEQIKAKDYEIFENGAALYQRFSEAQAKNEKIGLVISDIEMPQVDGLSCCKKIKSLNPATPVIIISSLINEAIARKCKEVGADISINKQDFSQLGEMIEKFVPGATSAKPAATSSAVPAKPGSAPAAA